MLQLPSDAEAVEMGFPRLSKAIQSALDAIRNGGQALASQDQLESLIKVLEKKIPPPPSQPVYPEPPQLPREPVCELPYPPSARYKQAEAKYNAAIRKLNERLSNAVSLRKRNKLRQQLNLLGEGKQKELLAIKRAEWPAEMVAKWIEHDEWEKTVKGLMQPFEREKAKIREAHNAAVREWETRNEIPLRIIARPKKETEEAFLPASTIFGQIEKLPWRFLPPSETGEERILGALQEFHRRHPELTVDESRLKFAYSLGPDHVYVGEDEFDGYFAFVFPHTRRVLLENPIEGNGAYVFAGDWKFLSKLPKTELLQFHGHEVKRAVHRGYWRTRVTRLLGIRARKWS